jgi:hypothetical protein
MSEPQTLTVVGLYQKVEVPEPKPVVPKPEVVIGSTMATPLPQDVPVVDQQAPDAVE